MELFPKKQPSEDKPSRVYPLLPPKNTPENSSKEQLPLFPNCSFMRGKSCDSTFWVPVHDLLKGMQYKVSLASYKKKFKDVELHPELKTQNLKCDVTWDQESGAWHELTPESTEVLCLDVKCLKVFALWYVSKMRRARPEKIRLCRLIGVDLDENDSVPVPVENDLLSKLEQACPFEMQRQYHLDRYRLDAFFPRIRVAIEIDEKGHSGYYTEEERRKDTVIRDHNIVLIRFNPHNDAGTIRPEAPYELIRKVWSRVVDPDFLAFRERHKLV